MRSVKQPTAARQDGRLTTGEKAQGIEALGRIYRLECQGALLTGRASVEDLVVRAAPMGDPF
ncbi:hypothetical protein PUR_34660 [Paenibacillus sp. URB8-2]|nr:hypothetical protein PUR_34660 [Paenibacillus sp. URB8-2]